MNAFRITAALEWQPEQKGEPRGFTMRAYDGGLLRLGNFPHPVVVDLAGVAQAGQVKALINHQGNNAAGHMTAVAITREITASGVLSVPSGAREVSTAQARGFQWEASIGARITATPELIEAGRMATVNGQMFAGPVYIIRACLLEEISFVGKGAGDNTAALAASSVPVGIPMADVAAAVSNPEVDEQLRREKLVHAVDRIAATYSRTDAQALDTLRASASAGTIRSENEIELSILRASRANKIVAGMQPLGGKGAAPVDSDDTIEAALMIQAGYESIAQSCFGQRVMEEANKLRRKSLLELHNLHLQAHGQPAFANIDDAIRASGPSTYSLPTTLGNTANRMLERIVRETPATWKKFAAQRRAKDFHDHTSIRPNMPSNLKELGPGGEMESASVSESTYTWSVDTYARTFKVARTSIINDGVGFFQEMLPLFSRGALRTLNDLFWRMALANAGNHFHANNGNYQEGSGSALQESSLITAIKQMRKQRDGEHNDLDIVPVVLVVPPELEYTAEKLIHSAEIQQVATTGGPTGNPLQNKLTLEVESRISNTAEFPVGIAKYPNALATRWYLVAGLQHVPFIVATSEDTPTPQVHTFDMHHVQGMLGMAWDCHWDIGCALGDPQAAQMSKGAA